MANAQHLALVRSGVEATWNRPNGRLDLRDADLSGLRLRGALLDYADLRGARLVGCDLADSRLQEANLSGAHLIRATLDGVRLGGSHLTGALLCSASLRRSYLVRCDLTGANLAGADFEAACLSHATMHRALFDRTKLVDADLAGVVGLDQVVHQGPSELGTHALLRFGPNMPEKFLRGVGLSDSFIRYLPAIVASSRPIDFCAVFIRAAAGDYELARRLHNDLQAAGIRCWLRQSEPTEAELDHSIHLHEHLLVLCSEHSRNDPSMTGLLAAAPGTKRWCLKIDDCCGPLPETNAVCDFRNWRDFRAYVAAFDSLVELLLA